MKTFVSLLFGLFLSVFLIGNTTVFAGNQNRGQYGDNPNEILLKIRTDADPTHMTESRLDRVNTNNQSFGASNRITNTLDALRDALGPYIQRIVFVSLSGAVILIIRNGFLLTTSMGDDTVQKEAKSRIMAMVKGIVVVTAAYFIIKLVISAITYILG